MIELGQLEGRHEDFAKRNTRVVAVSVDDRDESKKTQEQFPHLLVVSDSDQKVGSAAQVLHPHHGEDVALPTTFFIDKEGVVRSMFRPGQVPITRPSAEEVLQTVDRELRD